MRMLPGKQRARRLALGAQIGAGFLLLLSVISVLPFLLLISLVTALALIPTMRRLRKEMDQSGLNADRPARDQMVDITPIHARVIRDFWTFRRRER